MVLTANGCSQSTQGAGVQPSYDPYSGRLIQLSADQDGDGRVDQWTYLDGTRPIRGEKDDNNDGRIDRWEYFGAQAELLMVGTSSRSDGIEDTWAFVEASKGEGRIEVSVSRDRRVDRHEFYNADTLSRVELDTNGDGRVDRWDRYENKVLREVRFDTSFTAGRADRRLLYDPQGRFVTAEADDDGDGRFERVTLEKLPGVTGK
ncbi:MAG: hypothetical protein ABI983_01985 [Acidobacteriota bacterium]